MNAEPQSGNLTGPVPRRFELASECISSQKRIRLCDVLNAGMLAKSVERMQTDCKKQLGVVGLTNWEACVKDPPLQKSQKTPLAVKDMQRTHGRSDQCSQRT